MENRIVLLAAPGSTPGFGAANADSSRWNALVGSACRIRGSVYLADSAIRPEDLNKDGEFWTPLDESSWHIMMEGPSGEINAAMRLTPLPIDSRSRKGALPHIGPSLARSSVEGLRFRVERFLSEAGLRYGSERRTCLVIGGWVSNPAGASQGAGAFMALATWALARLTDSACGLAIASERHDAHGQLLKTGGFPFRAMGSEDLYFDPSYGCRVGLIGFRVFQERRSVRRVVEGLVERMNDFEVVLPV